MPNVRLEDLITEIKVTPLRSTSSSKTVAFASVTLANAIVLKDMRIVEGGNGLFVAMPQRKGEQNGAEKYFDIYNPISRDARDELNNLVIAAYEKEVSGGGRGGDSRGGDSRDSGRSGYSNRGGSESRGSYGGGRGREPLGAGARSGAGRGSRDDSDVPF